MKELTKIQTIRRDNFRRLVDSYGLKVEASKATGLSPSQVTDYYKGSRTLGERIATRIETNTGKPIGFLSNTPDVLIEVGHSSVTVMSNVEKAACPKEGGCPLIQWRDAAHWTREMIDLKTVKSWHLTDKEHGPSTYCLRVIGESMWNPRGFRPSYFDGDLIFVDPDQKNKAVNTSPVIALLDDATLSIEQRTVFKLLIIDGSNRYLKSINDAYPVLNADAFTVVGLVIGGAY